MRAKWASREADGCSCLTPACGFGQHAGLPLRPNNSWHAHPVSAPVRLLHALLDELSAEEVDAAVRAWGRSVESLPEEAKAGAAEELELVLRLGNLVDRYRRRAKELRALFETAGDLSSVRDVEGVLQAIVRRGRQLLGTDVAYLMLVDEDRHDTYMRVTEGTVSPGFSDIRLPLGVGLGGRVAQSLAPHWTTNYLVDDRYLHAIDEIVNEENLVAILGVPIKIGRRLLGVLFAADRTARDFSQDEVSLLASLGDHAAIAIENAGLFQETRAAVAALEAAKTTIERSNARLHLAAGLHERLMQLALEGGSVQDLVDVVADMMGGAVVVVDQRRREVARASTNSPALNEALALAINQLGADDLSRRSLRSDNEAWVAVVTPVIAGAERYGHLIYVAVEVEEPDVRSLERAATTMALLLLMSRATDEADNRVRGEILAELLMPTEHDMGAIVRRARLLEVDLDTDLAVLVVIPGGPHVSAWSLQEECGRLVRARRGLASVHTDRIVLLLSTKDDAELAERVAEQLAQAHLEAVVGSSGPFRDLGTIIRNEDRARRTAKLLLGLGMVGRGASAEELGIYGLMLSETGEEHVRDFIDRAIGDVMRYDADRTTALVATLDAYFSSEGNVAAAANQLFVHPNTLYQRLDRLDRLLGPGWRGGDRALELRLALRFRRLLEGSMEKIP